MTLAKLETIEEEAFNNYFVILYMLKNQR